MQIMVISAPSISHSGAHAPRHLPLQFCHLDVKLEHAPHEPVALLGGHPVPAKRRVFVGRVIDAARRTSSCWKVMRRKAQAAAGVTTRPAGHRVRATYRRLTGRTDLPPLSQEQHLAARALLFREGLSLRRLR